MQDLTPISHRQKFPVDGGKKKPPKLQHQDLLEKKKIKETSVLLLSGRSEDTQVELSMFKQ